MANRSTDPSVLHYQPELLLPPASGFPYATPNGALASLQWLEEVVTITTTTEPSTTLKVIPANSLFLGVSAIILTPVPTTSTALEVLTVSTPNIGTLLADTRTAGLSGVDGTPVWLSTATNIEFNVGDDIPTANTGTARIAAWWWNFTPPSQ